MTTQEYVDKKFDGDSAEFTKVDIKAILDDYEIEKQKKKESLDKINASMH